MFLFKVRRRLLTKMETTLKSNSAFSNVIVNFSENFRLQIA